jgi:hypothetical protein
MIVAGRKISYRHTRHRLRCLHRGHIWGAGHWEGDAVLTELCARCGLLRSRRINESQPPSPTSVA